MRRVRRKRQQEAELDITAFMNLMIVLVPVLLLGMVFSHIAVIDLKLPEASQEVMNNDANEQLELLVTTGGLRLYYPAGVLLKSFPKKQSQQDFDALSLYLRELKTLMLGKGMRKKDIMILSQHDTDYQTIVSAMDTVRSYRTVVATSVVDAELFPEIALGDAPLMNSDSRIGAL
jgi:biopolymer transport protein ExbD